MAAFEYVSYADASGYGIAAARYVRALVEAGHRVQWTPWPTGAVHAGVLGPEQAAEGRRMLLARSASAGGNAIEALLAATSAPLQARVRLIHLMPHVWPRHLVSRKDVRHVGMTAWETDRLPDAWLPNIVQMDHIFVPCVQNAAVFGAVPHGPPVHVVPHICAEPPTPLPPARLNRLAAWLRIRPGDTMFYTIGTWEPRKRMAALIDGFLRAFREDESAILVVKSGKYAVFDDPAVPRRGREVARMVEALAARAATELGRRAARVSVIAEDEVADSVIEGLHALGHCYVSLSRSEGFGLGAFDAATQGRPVICAGYGGPADYLGDDWPGRVPHLMVPAEAMPGVTWFSPDQNWPAPDDAAAFALMRQFMQSPAPFIAYAATTGRRIRRRFSAAPVVRRLTAPFGDGT